ncbi:MAG: TIGR00296 family protein [Desulfurococcaceae archaeon]
MTRNSVHPSELTLEEGVYLVRLARRAIEEYLKSSVRIKPTDVPSEKLLRPGMTFTTLEALDEKTGKTSLRGCIGFLAPVRSLVEVLVDSAIEAATGDPRFPPVELWEMNRVIVEVTVLSEPTPLRVEERSELPRHIVIGRHGLVVEKGLFKGTLLPVVPVEYCWDEETFLAETCLKAGLEPDCWLDPATRVYYYEGRVFREKTPRGDVYERDMSREYREQCLPPVNSPLQRNRAQTPPPNN